MELNSLLETAVIRLGFSAGVTDRVLKVGKTCADLSDATARLNIVI